MSENKENIENTEKDIDGNNGNESKPVKKRPTLEMLEAELKKEQNKSFEQYLVSVDSVCKIIPEQYSQNGYDLFRKLSNIAHGNSDEETALKEYAALKCLITAIIENVKKKQAEIKNNQEIQRALIEIGFAERGTNNG